MVSKDGLSLRGKLKKHYEILQQRDRAMIQTVEIHQLNKWLTVSLALLGIFYFFDVASTMLALASMSGFVEQNALVASLFGRGYEGFIWAMALKYFPLLPAAAVTYLKPQGSKSEFILKVAKLGVLAGLIAANFMYAFIVVHNASLIMGELMR